MSNQEAVGPHPSYIEIRKQFITEEKIQDFSDHARVNTAKEESMRLQGVSWIDNVRKVLRLYGRRPLLLLSLLLVELHTNHSSLGQLEHSILRLLAIINSDLTIQTLTTIML